MNIAIIVIAYNRLLCLKRILKSLSDAYFPKPVDLIISIDYGNNNDVIQIAEKFYWHHGRKKVKTHESNMGLRKHILSQGEEFNEYDALIILEDDIIVSPAFFHYSLQSIYKYFDNEDIAGISLYSFPINYQTGHPFEAKKIGYDVYFMKTAQSWGEIWMKRQWLAFYDWYLKNEEFTNSDSIPRNLFTWKKSWLKYHTRYCIENNKYFVYPYFSFSSNCGDQGVHVGESNNTYQANMQMFVIGNMNFPSNIEDGVRYDGFFENEELYEHVLSSFNVDDCCLDLNGFRLNSAGCRYLLSTRRLDYKVIKSFGLTFHPIENNVFYQIDGNDIFLYDTASHANIKRDIYGHSLYKYMYRVSTLRIFLKGALIDTYFAILRKIKSILR